MQYEVEVNGRLRQISVHRAGGRFVASIDGREWTIDAVRIDAYTLSLLIDTPGGERPLTRSYEVTLAPDGASGGLAARVDGTALRVSVNGRRRQARGQDAAHSGSGPQRIVAPMPGKIARILVGKGESVRSRQPVIVIEAMKMENELRAAVDGTISEIHVQDGQLVEAGALLAVIHR